MSNKSNRNLEIVIPILVYIQANLHEDLDLKVVAKKAGLSPFHFHRMFKNVVGETLKKYVLRIKLEKAAFALKYWDEKILSISNELGFQNHSQEPLRENFNILQKIIDNNFVKGNSVWKKDNLF
ncbi:helix-turn-helix transcriptional regulator [Bacillus mycoides]|uniref:helix-turn-helix transcriptional regulator n=1 Tax=Bacillus mycoides TaxID=1405 RepID=UPI001F194B8E|nr:AraC family transcriptional regulator [Bacillus mycoides]